MVFYQNGIPSEWTFIWVALQQSGLFLLPLSSFWLRSFLFLRLLLLFVCFFLFCYSGSAEEDGEKMGGFVDCEGGGPHSLSRSGQSWEPGAGQKTHPETVRPLGH